MSVAEPEERAHTLAAGATIFGLLCGHTVLEVARDSLFLERLSAEELVVAYLLIAVAATVGAQIDARVLRRFDDRQVLAATLVTGAAGAVGFHALFATEAAWVPQAFYVWTGTIASIAVAQFWRLLTGVFTVASAKRRFAAIGAGGALGAVVGAGAAGASRSWLETEDLLWVGSALLLATAALPIFGLPALSVSAGRRASEPAVEHRRETAGLTHRYLGRILVLLVVTSAAATLVDYTFKSTVDAEVAPAELVDLFSRFYLGLNLASMVVQIAIVPFVLRTLGVTRALSVLPIAVALGAAGTVVVGGLAAAILLRGVDGSLRQSLHKSATELLYFPLTPAARRRHKGSLDAIGQRAGQVLGSLAIVVAASWQLQPGEVALAVLALACVSIAAVASLRAGYVELFRANLRAGAIEDLADVPALDLHALESLIASLNSAEEDEVLAALELLVTYDRARLVPALILYHPSSRIVLRACELFRASGRTDHLEEARHLLDHPSEEVRAAATCAVGCLLSPDELRGLLEREPSPAARSGLLAALVGRGLDRDGAARRELDEACSGAASTRLALARALRMEASPALLPVLHLLAPSATPSVRREIARAFGELRDATAIGALVRWLGPRGARAEARAALVAIGSPALDVLEMTLADRAETRAVRAHVPRTISGFRSQRAASILLRALELERDDWVRAKVIRGLRALTRRPGIVLDVTALDRAARDGLARALEILHRRLAVRRARDARPDLAASSRLLEPLLRELEDAAVDRVVRLVALRFGHGRLEAIEHAIRASDPRTRADARELLANVAPPGAASALSALLEDADDDAKRASRAATALGVAEPAELGPRALVAQMLGDDSEAVRCIAAHLVEPLGLGDLADRLRDALDRATGLSRPTIERALASLPAAPGDVR